MTLYRTSVDGFSAIENRSVELLAHHLWDSAGHRPSPSEKNSWANSIPALRADLLSAMLILDGSHRVRETSVNRWTKSALRTGRPQLDEPFSAARVRVFLLDDDQIVRPGEQNTLEDIEKYAADHGIDGSGSAWTTSSGAAAPRRMSSGAASARTAPGRADPVGGRPALRRPGHRLPL